MTPRHYRMLAVVLILVGSSAAVALTLRAFNDNMLYLFTPSQVAAGEPPADRRFRVGGIVSEGSVRRVVGEMELSFDLHDNSDVLTVVYNGVLPDLFREGQDAVAVGVLEADGRFRADKVMARHDENYMSPEVAKALEEQGHSLPTRPQIVEVDAPPERSY